MLAQALVTEFLKLRRCKVTWGTLVGLLMAPLGLALFMWIVREPHRAAQLGLLGTKANLTGIEATWPSFAYMLTVVVGAGGMLVLSFIIAYIFGREYAEVTAKNMLALPVARHWFVVAKLVVAAVWWIVLVLAVIAESFVIGLLLGLPGFSAGLMATALGNVLLAALIAYLVVPPIAWAATLGRGYMPPIAFAILTLGLGDLFSHTGWAVWFPWSIIPLLVGMVGKPVESLPAGSYVVVALTFFGGIAATISQLRWADNTQ